MAIESQSSGIRSTPPVVENEIPAYRAISGLAIVAMLVGLVSLLSFAHLGFLVFSIAAVAMGALALRRIGRMPDLLTGDRMAKAGVALGLISGLAATTSHFVQAWLMQREASRFGSTYVKTLNEGDFASVVWYRANPDTRKDRSAQAILEEMTRPSMEPNLFEMEFGALRELKERIDAKAVDVAFEKVEDCGLEGLTPFAFLLLKVTPRADHVHDENDASHSHDHHETAYALVRAKAKINAANQYEWWVEGVSYPYMPNTQRRPGPKIDDGHGHAH